jgi:hypothetical protein
MAYADDDDDDDVVEHNHQQVGIDLQLMVEEGV